MDREASRDFEDQTQSPLRIELVIYERLAPGVMIEKVGSARVSLSYASGEDLEGIATV